MHLRYSLTNAITRTGDNMEHPYGEDDFARQAMKKKRKSEDERNMDIVTIKIITVLESK